MHLFNWWSASVASSLREDDWSILLVWGIYVCAKAISKRKDTSRDEAISAAHEYGKS